MEREFRRMGWWNLVVLCGVLAAGLLFVAGVIALIYSGIQWLGLQAAIAWTAFVILVFYLIKANYERKREHERLLADEKREQYFGLLEVLQECFFTDDPIQDARKHEQELKKWSLRLILIGSDEVVRAWRNFYDVAMGEFEDEDEDEEDEEEDSLFVAQANLLRALRRDCGHVGTTLTQSDLFAILLDDVAE